MSHGHDDHDKGAGHGGPATPPAPPPPPQPHVFTIARGSTWIGFLLWLGGAVAALGYLWISQFACFGWAAFASVYGFSIWLAARETLSLEYRSSKG